MEYISQSQRPKKPGTVPGHWNCPKTQNSNTMEYISQNQRPKSLGQSRAFGTVSEAQDRPGTVPILRFLTLAVEPLNYVKH